MRDGTIERWMALEMGRMRDGIVQAPRPLADLLLEDAPSAPTRGGEPHRFDRAVLERFAQALGPLARRRLRLPVTFYVDKEMPDDAYVADETAADLLRALREVPPELETREGRLWLSHAQARQIADRNPGAFQFTYL